MMLTLMLVAYTASSMALAIAAGQSVVSVATLLMTICFVFMMVSMKGASLILNSFPCFFLNIHLSCKENSVCGTLDAFRRP